MPKEVLLYGEINGYNAKDVMTDLISSVSDDIVLRVNGDGGELRYGWGVLGRIKELKGKKLFKNDGEANSMFAFSFCYNDNNEALDVSSFLFHRASYGEWYEGSEWFTETDRNELIAKNKSLRAALEAKVNVPVFERIIGVTLDQLFSLETRIDKVLNAQQALECGLINRIVPLTPTISSEIQAKKYALAAKYEKKPTEVRIAATVDPNIQTPSKMTLNEIKAKYPEAYKEIYAKGKAKGIELESDRVGSILAYIDADQKGVIEAIKSGKALTQTQHAEFSLKAVKAVAVKNLEDESEKPIVTSGSQKPAATAKEKELAAFKDEVFGKLNINKKAS